jgi:hypothetical protein
MKPENFLYSKQQLNRYKYAIKLAKKFKKYQDEEYLIFDNNELITDKIEFKTNFNNKSWSVVKIGDVTYIDISYWCNGGKLDGEPYIKSKKIIKKTFKSFSFVHPKHIKKII